MASPRWPVASRTAARKRRGSAPSSFMAHASPARRASRMAPAREAAVAQALRARWSLGRSRAASRASASSTRSARSAGEWGRLRAWGRGSRPAVGVEIGGDGVGVGVVGSASRSGSGSGSRGRGRGGDGGGVARLSAGIGRKSSMLAVPVAGGAGTDACATSVIPTAGVGRSTLASTSARRRVHRAVRHEPRCDAERHRPRDERARHATDARPVLPGREQRLFERKPHRRRRREAVLGLLREETHHHVIQSRPGSRGVETRARGDSGVSRSCLPITTTLDGPSNGTVPVRSS